MSNPSKLTGRDRWLILLLILVDIAIHPLGPGPDRLVHDPAVYRLTNPNYLPGDWYTEMATKSGVYTFYSHLVNTWQGLHLPEEFWRLIIYLACLVILYYAVIKIARLFSPSKWVVPIIAVLHAGLLTGGKAPWLYGPFMQIDGGLAPRSVGVSLSFLALYFLLTDSLLLAAAILGCATLIHVSNSLIIFSLYLLAWLVQQLLTKRSQPSWLVQTAKRAAGAVLAYLIAGGWLAIKLALAKAPVSSFTTGKFIWAWIYFRAPYFALLRIPSFWWLLFLLQGLIILLGWRYLKKRLAASTHQAIDLLSLIGLGGIVYLLIFYLFTFVRPWLPGFQFYSIRVIYLTYFVSFLYISIVLAPPVTRLANWLVRQLGGSAGRWFSGVGLLLLLAVLATSPGQLAISNLKTSGWRVLDSSVRLRSLVPFDHRLVMPQTATDRYLVDHPEPFLAPPNWNYGSVYLPSVASFKSFGFTVEGLPEWYNRLNDVSQGQLEQIYQSQLAAGRYQPVDLDWPTLYRQLSAEQINQLAQKYQFQLFLTYPDLTYPFQLMASDGDWQLYRLPQTFDQETQ